MILNFLNQYLDYRIIDENIKNRKKIYISGVNSSFLSLYTYALFNTIKEKIIIICDTEENSQKIENEINEIKEGMAFTIKNNDENKKNYLTYERLYSTREKSIIIIKSEDLIIKIPAREKFCKNILNIKKNQKINFDDLINHLIISGYERTMKVYNNGEFSLRGNIIDIYSPNNNLPVRIELFDDIVESIREFNPENQRSIKEISEIKIIPYNFQENNKEEENEKLLIDYLTEEKIIFLYEFENFKKYDELIFVEKFLENKCFIRFSKTLLNIYPNTIELTINRKPYINYESKELKEKIDLLLMNYKKIIITTRYEKQLERLKQLFIDYRYQNLVVVNKIEEVIENDFHFGILKLLLFNSLYFEKENIIIIPEDLLYNEEENYFYQWTQIDTKKIKEIQKISELKENDYVVHWEYGIGIYKGLETLTVEGVKRDFLHIKYANDGELYLPPTEFKYLSKYINYDETKKIELSDLNKRNWNKIKHRAKKKIEEIAYELMELYSARLSNNGYKFKCDTQEQLLFESRFSYEETPDQLKAIAEVKKEMESGKIMDRLICGDVGYGKTEVAIRAAFKAVQNKKQVAILVPTTILCLQHYDLFKKRFEGFNVSVEYISRFKNRSSQKEITKNLKEGKIDIIIGTHRLLQPDIEFNDLGLLIIDEEQRFGVKAKERIKLLKKNVSVLTLTATPIPRTLHLSLSGIREISIINTYPKNRLPIKTIIAEYDEQLIKKAILNELKRGGQIYFVHNNIETLPVMSNRIKNLVPHIRLNIVHSKMKAEQIEKIMYEFYQNKFDLLLCTTIIENGLDIPNVNTIIINNAENFGLAQLHQLRGRVGRTNIQAYAFLFHKGIDKINEEGKKRLNALKEYAYLGSGFELSMKDLQIRGAGNILGEEQSGIIMDIGYELYCQILKETLDELKEKEHIKRESVIIDYNISAYIPVDYISDVIDRIQIYKRILNAEKEEEIEELIEEIDDRYGRIPEPLRLLFEIGKIKIIARNKAIKEITIRQNEIIIEFIEPPINKLIELKNKLYNFTGYGGKKNSVIFGPYRDEMQMLNEIKLFLKEL